MQTFVSRKLPADLSHAIAICCHVPKPCPTRGTPRHLRPATVADTLARATLRRAYGIDTANA